MIIQIRAGKRTRRLIRKGYRVIGAVYWLGDRPEVFLQR
jgi:hypothetical protein